VYNKFMIELNIPGRGLIQLQHLVCDVNGTLAVDGLLAAGNTVQVRLPLGESLRGREKLDVVGVLEGEARRATAERGKPPA